MAEVLTGARTVREHEQLRYTLGMLRQLPLTDECWSRAAALGFHLRRAGVIVPLTDRLVAVVARVHAAELIECDDHFALMDNVPDSIS